MSYLLGAYLSRHRSVPDLRAKGQVDRRGSDKMMAWQGSDASGQGQLPHCHCRAPAQRSMRSCLMGTPDPSAQVRGPCTILPLRASTGSCWMWPLRVPQNQGPEVNRKGVGPGHHPGYSPGSCPGLTESITHLLPRGTLCQPSRVSWRAWSPLGQSLKPRQETHWADDDFPFGQGKPSCSCRRPRAGSEFTTPGGKTGSSTTIAVAVGSWSTTNWLPHPKLTFLPQSLCLVCCSFIFFFPIIYSILFFMF